MNLSIFENYEFLGELCTHMPLENKCGDLFVEILNNYPEIKERLYKSIKTILELKDQHIIKTYLDSFLYTLPLINYKLQFFYDTIQIEFKELSENFSNAQLQVSEQLNNLMHILKNTDTKNKEYKYLNEYKENLEKALQEFSFDNAIKNQLMYIDSLINALELNYTFIKEYNYDSNYDYYFKSFELPRETISCVIKQNNEIRLLESKNQYICGNLSERISIEKNSSNNIKYLTSYKIEKASDLLEVYRKLIIDKKICIKKCKNCNNFFVTESRTDEKYCNNASPQNPKKTCKEYGAKKTYRDEIKSVPLKNEHNKTSQFFRMRINRTKDQTEKETYINQFDTYKEGYQKKKKQYKSGKLKEQDFIEWIINQKEGVKNGSTRNNKK